MTGEESFHSYLGDLEAPLGWTEKPFGIAREGKTNNVSRKVKNVMEKRVKISQITNEKSMKGVEKFIWFTINSKSVPFQYMINVFSKLSEEKIYNFNVFKFRVYADRSSPFNKFHDIQL